MNRLMLVASCIWLASCGQEDPVPPPVLPQVVVLSGPSGLRLLEQCTRDAPPPAEATWRPRPSDIAALEALLPQALAARPESQQLEKDLNHPPDPAKAPQGWHRQYVGVVRQGRRFIYGSFFPSFVRMRQEFDTDDSWRDTAAAWSTGPLTVCDGGPGFFGVEYDVVAGRISHLAFNGSLESPSGS